MTFYMLALWSSVACLSSIFLTKFMVRINIEDVPNVRSSHVKITPKGGGVGVALPFLGAVALYDIFFPGASFFGTPLLFGSLVMVVMGLWDDLKGLSWRFRLSFQVMVTLFMVGSGVYFKTLDFPYFGTVSLGIWGPILSGLGMVAFINLYNFMDGLNGLATGSTLIGLIFYALILVYVMKDPSYSFTFFCCILLISALSPVFFFNFFRGEVFLGDVGSQFLGCILPILGVLGTFESSSLLLEKSIHGGVTPFLIPLLFFNFIFDGFFTLLLRTLKGKKLWEADRGHLFHMVMDKDISSQKVVYLHFIFFTIQGFIALYFTFCLPLRFFPCGILMEIILYSFYAYWLLKKPSQKRSFHA